jgi:hypothetical protein
MSYPIDGPSSQRGAEIPRTVTKVPRQWVLLRTIRLAPVSEGMVRVFADISNGDEEEWKLLEHLVAVEDHGTYFDCMNVEGECWRCFADAHGLNDVGHYFLEVLNSPSGDGDESRHTLVQPNSLQDRTVRG